MKYEKFYLLFMLTLFSSSILPLPEIEVSEQMLVEYWKTQHGDDCDVENDEHFECFSYLAHELAKPSFEIFIDESIFKNWI